MGLTIDNGRRVRLIIISDLGLPARQGDGATEGWRSTGSEATNGRICTQCPCGRRFRDMFDFSLLPPSAFMRKLRTNKR